MINNVVLVGRLVGLPKMLETPTGIKYATIRLEVMRPFKNSSGVYDSDKVSVTLWKGIAKTANDVCKIGDMLGIKGRIQSEDGITYEIVAEHVSFMRI